MIREVEKGLADQISSKIDELVCVLLDGLVELLFSAAGREAEAVDEF